MDGQASGRESNYLGRLALLASGRFPMVGADCKPVSAAIQIARTNITSATQTDIETQRRWRLVQCRQVSKRASELKGQSSFKSNLNVLQCD